MNDATQHSSLPVAFITGASSGFGAGLARRLAREGFAVGLSARRGELLEEIAAEIEGGGGQARAYPCDVADRDGLLAAIRRWRKRDWPRIKKGVSFAAAR